MAGTIWFWAAVAGTGLGLVVLSGHAVVRHAARLAASWRLPPFFIGSLFLALGTEIPEIANSVMASWAGQGDVNVGNAIGSVVTELTLILGLLPFAGKHVQVGPNRPSVAVLMTMIALNAGAWMVVDGYLTRWDAVLLLLLWGGAMAAIWRATLLPVATSWDAPTPRKFLDAVLVLAGLLVVAAGAGMAVKAIVELSTLAGVPQYLLSFFGVSLGTSLPEFVISLIALSRGQRELAWGSLVGAGLHDATLAVGAGALIAPTVVSANLALRGAVVAMGVVFLVELLIWARKEHDRWTGSTLLLLYAATYFVMR